MGALGMLGVDLHFGIGTSSIHAVGSRRHIGFTRRPRDPPAPHHTALLSAAGMRLARLARLASEGRAAAQPPWGRRRHRSPRSPGVLLDVAEALARDAHAMSPQRRPRALRRARPHGGTPARPARLRRDACAALPRDGRCTRAR